MSVSAVRSVEVPDSSGGAPGTRRLILAALALVTAAALLAALAPAAGALPPDRAYEKVSPNDKDGADIANGLTRAAAQGGAVTYGALAGFGNQQGAGLIGEYYGERTPTGWTSQGISPPEAPVPGLGSSIPQSFTPDASTSVFLLSDGELDGGTPGTFNIYRRNPAGVFDLITVGQPAPTGSFAPNPTYGGGSDDLSLIAFEINTDPAIPVTSGPDGVNGITNAYAGDGTSLRLVSVLPNGTASPTDSQIGSNFSGGGQYNAVSADGSRIFWSTGGFSTQEVYVRIDGSSTEWVSESERTPPDPAGPQTKNYQYATPDGDFAFFTSAEKLTNGAQATAGAPDLYRYNVATGDLVDLTNNEASGAGAGVLGVLGVSDSGGRVYFAATGDLAANVPPPPEVPAGQPKLYLREGAETTFIAALDTSGFQNSDDDNWSGTGGAKTAQVTPDGNQVLFASKHQQGSYDNAGFRQFYLYDAAADTMTCVSCNPSGAPATGDAALFTPPGGIQLQALNTYQRHILTADGGTAFFGSPERLLPKDTNGKFDVYMWENGNLELISTGQSNDGSYFVDSSADANDAFFLTREQLVGIDTDNQVDLYDARVGGGIAAQNPPPAPPLCQGDECQGAAAAQSTPQTPGSATVHNPPRTAPSDCSSLESKADRKAKKAKKAKKKAKKARKKAKKLKKKAKKASGKKADKLQKKAKKAKKKSKKKKKQAKKKHKKAKKAKKQARDCKRGQGR